MAHPTSLTNLKKEKKTGTWNLEACCVESWGGGVAAASALLTSVLSASDVIDRRPLFPQLPRGDYSISHQAL